MTKKFRIPAEEMRELATGRGGCFASNLITAEGYPVGYMYREDEPGMSGWAFFAGTETQEYADKPSNFEIYDVNTIANYDPLIIPLLDSPTGSSFERVGEEFRPA